MIRIFRVSELLENIKITLNENFPVVDVKGEISDVNINSKSGHIYFNLKEDKAVISCACWKSNASKLQPFIESGKHVKLRGRVLSYPSNSKFYINVVRLEEEGEGDANKKLLELRSKLVSEGLFLETHKKFITKFPNTIGLITSCDGDVIEDIKTTLNQTYPCKILLKDVHVQGEDSVDNIIKAIIFFNELPSNAPDFIIIARGGGNSEDLFHFNDEKLVRTIFSSKIPIITAIGHQPDSTLADLVADKSVATPTASVAFLANTNIYKEYILHSDLRLLNIYVRNIDIFSNRVKYIHKALKNPASVIDNRGHRILSLKAMSKQFLWSKLEFYQSQIAMLKLSIDKSQRKITDYEKSLQIMTRMLENLSFKETLKRGFTVVHQGSKLIKNTRELSSGVYEIEFHDGKKSIVVK